MHAFSKQRFPRLDRSCPRQLDQRGGLPAAVVVTARHGPIQLLGQLFGPKRNGQICAVSLFSYHSLFLISNHQWFIMDLFS
jgi:hypothetical protein